MDIRRDSMFENLSQRAIHKNWKTTLFLFVLLAIVHFIAAYLKSLVINFVGLLLFALVTLIFVRKSDWPAIRIRKPIRLARVLWGLILSVVFVFGGHTILYLIVDYSPANFMVIMAKQQMSYGVINKYNAWQYFPIAAIGFSTISPFTEELFFRGALLRSFEYRFSALAANLVQGFLFGFIHLAYFWLTEFNLALIITMVPFITLAGMLYGWITQETKSVISSMIVHAFCNFVLVFAVYAFIIPDIYCWIDTQIVRKLG